MPSDLQRAGSDLALEGGEPVRRTSLPYGRQSIDEEDIAAVVAALRSDWLTTGPRVEEFEQAFAGFTGSKHAVALSSGTAALHTAMFALDIQQGDEVIVPPLTFAATANCVLYQGGTPIFADVDHRTLLLDPAAVEAKVTPRTRAIIAVDYAGQPCDYQALRAIADRHGLALVADACHSLGGADGGRSVGTLADLTCFSLHPVKHITTGEGGIVTTQSDRLARRARRFRNHGITSDHRQREKTGSWFYEMVDLGYNYRITDIQCALGTSQLTKLPKWIARRQEIARLYNAGFSQVPGVRPVGVRAEASHAYHLYVVRIEAGCPGTTRDEVFAALRAEGIGVNVHYVPVHLHPYYRQRFGTHPGMLPVTEAAYEQIVSLPMFPMMGDDDVRDVLTAVERVTRSYAGGH